MTAPIIGVTPSVSDNHLGVRSYNVAADYTQAIERAGGIPMILPLHVSDISRVLDQLDGIVFSGGGDIDPELFHQERHETVSYVDAERDAFEINLMQQAFARNLPILAICRGMQVMNVAQGGDLIQDIPSQTGSVLEHSQRDHGVGEHEISQQASVSPGDNPFTRALGEGPVDINSFHHQSVGDVAPTLQVAAVSEDGIVEAVYAPDYTYAIGTQWHPERLAAEYPGQQALFNNLIQAAITYASQE